MVIFGDEAQKEQLDSLVSCNCNFPFFFNAKFEIRLTTTGS